MYTIIAIKIMLKWPKFKTCTNNTFRTYFHLIKHIFWYIFYNTFLCFCTLFIHYKLSFLNLCKNLIKLVGYAIYLLLRRDKLINTNCSVLISLWFRYLCESNEKRICKGYYRIKYSKSIMCWLLVKHQYFWETR